MHGVAPAHHTRGGGGAACYLLLACMCPAHAKPRTQSGALMQAPPRAGRRLRRFERSPSKHCTQSLPGVLLRHNHVRARAPISYVEKNVTPDFSRPFCVGVVVASKTNKITQTNTHRQMSAYGSPTRQVAHRGQQPLYRGQQIYKKGNRVNNHAWFAPSQVVFNYHFNKEAYMTPGRRARILMTESENT